MALKGLKEAVSGLKLLDTRAVFAQGQKAFMFGIEYKDRDSVERSRSYELQNPYKNERERKVWQDGYNRAREQWFQNSRKQGGTHGNR